jgi:para-nitrobenzyl esterase
MIAAVKTYLSGAAIAALLAANVATAQPVKTAAGTVAGTTTGDGKIRIFKGIPYAAPPVGENRWKEPKPGPPWQGTRDATEFGAQCVQGHVFDDISFSRPASEDCLNLNIWTPASAATDRLPVMVWIHGGGFQVGAGGEPRHDGEAFARRGIVLVTINYRLGVFGFFSHPELTRESARNASGNYGLLDQIAALEWVKANIAAFGGDPSNVTIFGESAGSFSVSALMASPLAAGLFQKAIGESGAYFTSGSGTLGLQPLKVTEEQGTTFASSIGASSLADLRAKPAEELLAAAMKVQPRFSPNIDGYVLREEVYTTFAAGRQAHVPLLAGWNADESRANVVLNPQKPTAQSFADDVRKRFGVHADTILRAYQAASDVDAIESAAALASDTFIGHSTWKWIEMQAATGGGVPVYRYSFDRKIPVPPNHTVMGRPASSTDVGARHAGEIQYVFGTLVSVPDVVWEASDKVLSDAMTRYWANFAKKGDPNGAGLPVWPKYDPKAPRVLHLDVTIKGAPDTTRARYEALEAFVSAQR